jgi:hypothetical protein
MTDQLSLEGKAHQSGVNCEKFRRNGVFSENPDSGDDLFLYPELLQGYLWIKADEPAAPYLDVNG